jgi:inositol-phosphate transport system permease protein
MATTALDSRNLAKPTQSDWDRLVARARWSGRARTTAVYGFLIAVSLPGILPSFWLVTIAFSAKTGVVETPISSGRTPAPH